MPASSSSCLSSSSPSTNAHSIRTGSSLATTLPHTHPSPPSLKRSLPSAGFSSSPKQPSPRKKRSIDTSVKVSAFRLDQIDEEPHQQQNPSSPRLSRSFARRHSSAQSDEHSRFEPSPSPPNLVSPLALNIDNHAPSLPSSCDTTASSTPDTITPFAPSHTASNIRASSLSSPEDYPILYSIFSPSYASIPLEVEICRLDLLLAREEMIRSAIDEGWKVREGAERRMQCGISRSQYRMAASWLLKAQPTFQESHVNSRLLADHLTANPNSRFLAVGLFSRLLQQTLFYLPSQSQTHLPSSTSSSPAEHTLASRKSLTSTSSSSSASTSTLHDELLNPQIQQAALACLQLACKFEHDPLPPNYPLYASGFSSMLSANDVSDSILAKTELEVLQALEFSINASTVHTFLQQLVFALPSVEHALPLRSRDCVVDEINRCVAQDLSSLYLDPDHARYPSSSIAFILLIFALRSCVDSGHFDEAQIDEVLGDVLQEGRELLSVDQESLDEVQSWMMSVLDG